MKKAILSISLLSQVIYAAHTDYNRADELTKAITADNAHTTRLVLRAGASINTPPTPTSLPPLTLALKMNPGGSPVIDTLLQEQQTLNFDQANIFGFTPVAYAIFQFIRGDSKNLDQLAEFCVDYPHPSIKKVFDDPDRCLKKGQLVQYIQKQHNVLQEALSLPLSIITQREKILTETKPTHTPFDHQIILEYLYTNPSFIESIEKYGNLKNTKAPSIRMADVEILINS